MAMKMRSKNKYKHHKQPQQQMTTTKPRVIRKLTFPAPQTNHVF